jgi:hypothetical protein
MVDVPLDVVAKAILVAMTHALDYEGKRASMAAYDLAAVSVEAVTCEKISIEREVSKKFSTVWSLAIYLS